VSWDERLISRGELRRGETEYLKSYRRKQGLIAPPYERMGCPHPSGGWLRPRRLPRLPSRRAERFGHPAAGSGGTVTEVMS